MPKGISQKSSLLRQLKAIEQNVLVPKGATLFPGTDEPIPQGVTIRSSSGIQIEFMFNGMRHYETIRGKPTIQHVLDAIKKRERVIQLIGLNTFDYEKEFPNGKALKTQKAEAIRAVAIPITIATALDEWLVTALASVGPTTGEDYTKDIKLLKALSRSALEDPDTWDESRGDFGEMAVDELTDVSITRLRTWLQAKPVSVKRVINLMTPLRGALSRLCEQGKLEHNPFTSIRPLKSKRTFNKKNLSLEDELDTPLPIIDGVPFNDSTAGVEPFSLAELNLILKQLSGPFLNLILFWAWTGLRTGELIALRWSDIDWSSGKMYVRRSLSRGHLKKPKFDKSRWVALCEPARKALEAQLQFSGKDKGWVFPNPFTKKMWANESKIQTRFKKASDRADVRYRRPYNLRHTFASIMLSSGENPLYVAEQMGHKDWSMLIRVYGRWIKDGDNKAGQRVETMHTQLWSQQTAFLASHQIALDEPTIDNDKEPDNVVISAAADADEY